MVIRDVMEMSVPAKSAYISVVRLTVSGVAHRLGFTYDDIEDIKVAISEAVTNAVQHAYQRNEQGTVGVGFRLYDDRLEMMVADDGHSFDFERVYDKVGPVPEDVPVQQLSEGGLGLLLMETLMDQVHISSDHGVMVLMTKYVQRDRVKTHDETITTS